MSKINITNEVGSEVITEVTHSDSKFYILMRPTSQQKLWFRVFDYDSNHYITKGTATLEAGKFYNVDLKLATVGDVILADGSFAAPGTGGAVAMIGYLGWDGVACQNGLAIALEDVNNGAITTVYTGHFECATFTLVGDGGSSTGTFTGEIPEEWALEENQELWINYPELEQITIDGNTEYCFIDGRKQTGKLDDFMDILSGQLIYTGGSLKVKEGAEIQHMASYLHLLENIELFAGDSSLEGDVTLTLSNIISGQHSGGFITDNIEVTATLSGGRLTSDVYIGFLAHPILTPKLKVACGDIEVTYTLDRFGGYKTGEMYTVNNIASLATPGPLTLEAINDGTITIKNPLGLAISYEKEGEAKVTSEKDNTDDITIDVSAGTRVRFYGDNKTYCNSEDFTNIDCSSDCYIYGNIMSLINSQNYYDETVLRETYTFSYLFRNNKHIKNHNSKPLILPATTLSAACYSGMFYGCELLETAPELPSEQLAFRCYWGMFGLCSALTTAPELRAQTLAEGCYYQMFGGCSSLETAPELLAKELKKECYYQMFAFCPKLNSLTCLATVIPAEDCTYQWLRSTSATGTFTKAASMNDWSIDISGIPSGWTINNYVE